VLPQKLTAHWAAQFDAETHAAWVHRVGNLVLLHGKVNAKASNLGWSEKRKRYRDGSKLPGGGTSIPLTDDVVNLASDTWGVHQLRERQQMLLGCAISCWGLHDTGPGAGAA
jgi:hypothetical protein